jgi:hypothetical protein
MELDPIPEDIRKYLREHFQEVTDEPPRGDSYIFSVTASGTRRELKVHRNFFTFSDLAPRYLREHDIARQLKHGDVSIVDPLK